MLLGGIIIVGVPLAFLMFCVVCACRLSSIISQQEEGAEARHRAEQEVSPVHVLYGDLVRR